eukprot:gene11559-15447_t
MMSMQDDRTARAGLWQPAATIPAMKTDLPLPLLGGLSPARFMQRHWQKTPHLIRQAVPGMAPPVSRAELLALAARDDVESRLVVQGGATGWQLRHGPFQR